MLTNSVTETKNLAKNILKDLSGNLLCLYGPLGAGKTTFVQGLAEAVGIKQPVVSPSFLLVREYQKGDLKLIHVDCYRIKSVGELKSIDLQELWSNPNNLVVIEWADRVKKILPKERIDIKFSYVNPKKRKIDIVY